MLYSQFTLPTDAIFPENNFHGFPTKKLYVLKYNKSIKKYNFQNQFRELRLYALISNDLTIMKIVFCVSFCINSYLKYLSNNPLNASRALLHHETIKRINVNKSMFNSLYELYNSFKFPTDFPLKIFSHNTSHFEYSK